MALSWSAYGDLPFTSKGTEKTVLQRYTALAFWAFSVPSDVGCPSTLLSSVTVCSPPRFLPLFCFLYLALFLLHCFVYAFIPLLQFLCLAFSRLYTYYSPCLNTSSCWLGTPVTLTHSSATNSPRILLLFSCPEGGGTKLLWNVGNKSPINTASYARGL
jgi:hypothetical protein